jgi:RNA polymerase sigma factor (sigma-70 family)
MSDNNQTTLLPYLLLQGASLPEWQNRTDAELLTEYARQGSELAFAALVHRHGPMVWRICWHRLRHYQDAEDAFQATFLVLARRAADIRPPEMLANWLYGVARQTAHKASLMAARRRHKETSLTQQTDSAAAAVKPEEECLLDCLYEEVAHLPEKFRAVVVLCDLEGLSRKEAGRQLGVPEGTVAGWLARARQLLHKRLARRGITLSLAAGLATLQANASAAPYRAVLASVRVASLLKAGESLAAAVPAKVTILAHAVMRSLSTGSLAVTLGGTIILSLALVWWQGWNSFPVRQFSPQDHRAYDFTELSDSRTSSPATFESPRVSAERGRQDGHASSAQLDSPAIELSRKPKTKPAVTRTATPTSGEKLESHKVKKPAQKKEEDDDDDADDRFRDEDTYTVHGLVFELDAEQQTLSITCWQKVTPHLKTFRLARGVRVWNRGRHDDLSVLQQGMWVQLEVCPDNHCVVRVKLKPKPKWLEERKT